MNPYSRKGCRVSPFSEIAPKIEKRATKGQHFYQGLLMKTYGHKQLRTNTKAAAIKKTRWLRPFSMPARALRDHLLWVLGILGSRTSHNVWAA